MSAKKPHKAKPSSGGTRKYNRNRVGRKAGAVSLYMARKGGSRKGPSNFEGVARRSSPGL